MHAAADFCPRRRRRKNEQRFIRRESIISRHVCSWFHGQQVLCVSVAWGNAVERRRRWFFGIYDITAACITLGCYNELEATALNSDWLMKLLPVIHKPEAKILLLDLVLAILFSTFIFRQQLQFWLVFGKGKCVVKLHLIKLTWLNVARRLIATF